jgi:hypothetical protein
MKLFTRLCAVVAGVAILSSILACGAAGKVREAAGRQKTANDLKQIGIAWLSHNDATRKAPSRADDLFPYMEGPTSPVSIALKSGMYTVYYGVSIDDIIKAKDSPGTSQTVLGYEAAAPTAGGMVLMADGSVLRMVPAQFAAARKADSFKKN